MGITEDVIKDKGFSRGDTRLHQKNVKAEEMESGRRRREKSKVKE